MNMNKTAKNKKQMELESACELFKRMWQKQGTVNFSDKEKEFFDYFLKHASTGYMGARVMSDPNYFSSYVANGIIDRYNNIYCK